MSLCHFSKEKTVKVFRLGGENHSVCRYFDNFVLTADGEDDITVLPTVQKFTEVALDLARVFRLNWIDNRRKELRTK